jgi:catechol 1,2-dioxygenase
VTYPEYYGALQYLLRLDEPGEAMLLAAVFLSSTVDTVNNDNGRGTAGQYEGSHYKPGAPWLEPPFTLPMRPDEPGDPLLFHGRVESVDGGPLANATVDVWQSNSDGVYSLTPGTPNEYLLRGRLRTDSAGEFDIRTVRPAPYQVPNRGPVSDLLENILGRHTWRAAHIHVKIVAAGYKRLLTQLYFPDDPYLDSDCLSAVKDSLVMDLSKTDADGGSYRGEYVFRLMPTRDGINVEDSPIAET